MTKSNPFSDLYVIADADVLSARGCRVRAFAEEMLCAGVRLLQYRNKTGGAQTVLRDAAILREVFAGKGATLILNDRVDLAVLAEWDGVHVGQEDLVPEDAKAVMAGLQPHPSQGREGWGTRHQGIVGVSTHTCCQVRAAEASCADYVAIGPVFATGTKLDASAVVGLEGVRRARALTGKPLVAIGGITRENARSVVEAGADAVAVISALVAAGERPGRVAEDFLAVLG